MTRTEAKQFINRELKGLWPQWMPTEAELSVWIGVLARYAYDVARAALQQAFCEQARSYHRPLPARFLAKARLLATPGGSPAALKDDPDTNVFIRCIEPPTRNANLHGVERAVYVLPREKQSDPDYARACAEVMRRRFEQLYDGQWATLVKTPVSPTNSPFHQTCTATQRDAAASLAHAGSTTWAEHHERPPPP